jgi:hypothetical protein
MPAHRDREASPAEAAQTHHAIIESAAYSKIVLLP